MCHGGTAGGWGRKGLDVPWDVVPIPTAHIHNAAVLIRWPCQKKTNLHKCVTPWSRMGNANAGQVWFAMAMHIALHGSRMIGHGHPLICGSGIDVMPTTDPVRTTTTNPTVTRV